jgi:predicted methyltransferase
MGRWSIAPLLVAGLCAAGPRTAAEPLKITEDPQRDAWQLPLIVLGLLGIDAGSTVADLHADTGYFTALLAYDVGTAGRVLAVDTRQKALDAIMARPELLRERIVPLLARPADPGLPAGQVDLAFSANAWHRLSKRARYLEALARGLAPGGRVVVIDWREGQLPVGPPEKKRLPREQVVQEFEAAGYRLIAESIALPYQYCLMFSAPAARPQAGR